MRERQVVSCNDAVTSLLSVVAGIPGGDDTNVMGDDEEEDDEEATKRLIRQVSVTWQKIRM